MRFKFFFLVWLSVGLLLAACGPRAAAPPAPTVIGQAPVEGVTVALPPGTPDGPQVLVRGNLPDTCTRLGDPGISRGGELIVIVLPTYRDPAAQDCAGPQPYERAFSLGSDMLPGHYTVSVNGAQAVFDLNPPPPAEPTPTTTAPLQPAPTPTPQTAEAAPEQDTVQVSANPAPKVNPPTPSEEQPAAQPASAPAAPPPADCEVKGAFFADVSAPDGTLFNPGEPFTKIWRIRNAGTCPWQGFSLVFQKGDALGSAASQPIPQTVAPGEMVDLAVDFVAPLKPGQYFSDWLLATNSGELFGLGNPAVGLLWVKIGVRAPPAENPQPAPPPAALPVTGPSESEKACAYLADPASEAQILELINAARAEHALPPLQLVEALSTAARQHSADMACHNFVDHYGYDGSTWLTRITAQGVPYRRAAENIYAGNPEFGGTPQGAFTWWMNSQIHRDNILNPKVSQIGIGYVYYTWSDYRGYYTLNFVAP